MEANRKGKLIWISAYLYYKGEENHLLKDFVHAFIKSMRLQQALHRYFFIRYYESGYHIRLRFLIPELQEKIWKRQLKEKFIDFTERQESDESKSPNKNFISYKFYEPELQRYGGECVISIAELQFEASSDYVLNVLKEIGDLSLLSIAIKMNTALLGGLKLTLEQMAQICKQFVDDWLPSLYDSNKDQSSQKEYFLSLFLQQADVYEKDLVPAVNSILDNLTDSHCDESIHFYHAVCGKIADQYQAKRIDLSTRPDIVGSFMHMNHNRLGIKNLDEAYLVYLLYRALLILKN